MLNMCVDKMVDCVRVCITLYNTAKSGALQVLWLLYRAYTENPVLL